MPLPRAKVVQASKPRLLKASQWMRLEKKIEALPGDRCHGEILNLASWKTIKCKELDHDIVIMVELNTPYAGNCVCPAAESEMNKIGFTDPYHMHDLPIRCRRVI